MSDDTRPDASSDVPDGAEAPAGDEFGAWFDREFTDDGSAAAGPALDESALDEAVLDEPALDAERFEDAPLGDAPPADAEGVTPASPSPARRVAGRMFRRPIAWWQRPWSTDRIVRVLVTSATLVTTTVVVMMIVHLNPLSPARDLIFDDTTPTGGDMGAHVWAPAFLRDHLLSNFQLSGWTMDWYGGLPLYRFYMVIPALAIVALGAHRALGTLDHASAGGVGHMGLSGPVAGLASDALQRRRHLGRVLRALRGMGAGGVAGEAIQILIPARLHQGLPGVGVGGVGPLGVGTRMAARAGRAAHVGARVGRGSGVGLGG